MMKALILAFGIVACGPSETALEGAQFAGNLEECNRRATNLCDSIACENRWRAIKGRMARKVPVHCRDDGGIK